MYTFKITVSLSDKINEIPINLGLKMTVKGVKISSLKSIIFQKILSMSAQLFDENHRTISHKITKI